ncbi:ABC transporter ATP-binding protein [Streptomyces sp. NPDC001508]|uniref:ABC transporter ATP-binding protein n=1 Tax=Streptomyces sp. NPDC001508 TaxID=3154656 RepID=UPI003327650B
MIDSRVLVHAEALSIQYSNSAAPAVHNVSVRIERGERLGIAGESGSGKSTLALGLIGHARPGGRKSEGTVRVVGEDVFTISASQRRALWRKHIGYVPQGSAGNLTEAMRISSQLTEVARLQQVDPDADWRHHWLSAVMLDNPAQIERRYPHQLSGGQRQRVALALALAQRPDLLILDEPTTGLDSVTQAGIVQLINQLTEDRAMTLICISHDLSLLAAITDRVAVMRAGSLVETGDTRHLLTAPHHPFTQKLVAANAYKAAWRQRLSATPPAPTLRHVPQSTQPRRLPSANGAYTGNILTVSDLNVRYGPQRRWSRRPAPPNAVTAVDLAIEPGRTLALVGESGSGKSTIARAIAGVHPNSTGHIQLDGQVLADRARSRTPQQRRAIQLVMQHPETALNPRRTVFDIVARATRLHHIVDNSEIPAYVTKLLNEVGITPEFARRYPAQLSGGQRQRVSIATALSAQPALLVCDEVVSALDTTVAATVVDLLRNLQRERHMAMLFITHDLALTRSLADEVIVLRQGRIVERGSAAHLLDDPSHEYTRQLVAASRT